MSVPLPTTVLTAPAATPAASTARLSPAVIGWGRPAESSQPEDLEEPALVLALDAGDDLEVLLQRAAAQLGAEALVDLEEPRRVRHLDLDADRLLLPRADADLVDRVVGEGVDVLVAGLPGHARAALGHVERVGHAHDRALERERPAARAVRDDGVHRLGDQHRPLRLLVDARQQRAELVGGQEQRVALVVGAVDRHPGVVEERRRGDDDLGVALLEAVVGDGDRDDAAAEQQPRDAQGDVRDDLDVDPRVVGHLQAVGVEARDVPPRLELLVLVDRVDEPRQPAIAPDGDTDTRLVDLVAEAHEAVCAPSAARAAWPTISSRCTLRSSPCGRRRTHSRSVVSSQAFVLSARQRSSVSRRSSRIAGSSTGATSSTRLSRLRGMRSAEPMRTVGDSASRWKAKMRECSRKRPTTETTEMFSLTSGTPGTRQQMPRMLSSTGTPACEARYRARMQRRSTSAFIFIAMRASRPSRLAWTVRSICSRIPSRRNVGATSASR